MSWMGKYKTLDKEAYAAELDSYNTAELRSHAINIGLIPIVNINRLTFTLSNAVGSCCKVLLPHTTNPAKSENCTIGLIAFLLPYIASLSSRVGRL